MFTHLEWMGKGNAVAKKLKDTPKKASRTRSDLNVPEFGGDGRYRDESLNGSAASLLWNTESVNVCCAIFSTSLIHTGGKRCAYHSAKVWKEISTQAPKYWEEQRSTSQIVWRES